MIHHIILGHLMSSFICISDMLTKFMYGAVLDPRIGYEGLLADCGDDTSM